ncbi:hypothetical protein AB6D15_25000 [Vibrio splendidus]
MNYATKPLVGNVFCLETLPKQELQTQVVDLPLGQQDNDSPINLLAGIQPEHLSDLSYENLNRFAKSSDVPIEIIRKHSTYDVDVITEAYDLITRMSSVSIGTIKNIWKEENLSTRELRIKKSQSLNIDV